ncbi:MAG: dockerin type I repeat-containing protein [Candidatus Fimenecus sp.]
MKKRILCKKMLAVFLAVLLTVWFVPICVGAAESEIAYITAEDMQIIVGTNGGIFSDYDPEIGDYTEGYFRYWYTPTVTAFFQDGTSQEVTGGLEWNGEWYGISCTDDQSAATPWGIGTHTATVEFLGATAECTVEIIESPVVRIEPADIAPIQIIEGTNGYMDSEYDPETDSTVEYFRYWYAPTVTAFFQDGTSQEVTGGLEWNGEWYGFSCTDDQSAATPWGIGSHTATVELLGATLECTVEIVESPVLRMEVAPIQIIEGTNGDVFSDYDPETDSTVEYFHYWYSPAVTVFFQDGTSQKVYGGLEWNGEWYGISYTDDQSVATPWGIGTHTAVAEFLGVATECTVEIVENPVVRIELTDNAPIQIIEGTNGYMDSEFDPETDSTVEYFRYWYSPTVTVFFQDGTSQEVTGGLEWNGEWYGFSCTDDQSAATPWDIGTHTATVEFLGATVECTVEIVESPIVSLCVTPDRALIQGLDTFEAFPEILQFDMTVFYKDGTQISGDFSEIYLQTGYYPSISYDISPSDWSVGTQTVSVSFMGISVDIDIEIIANPYESITISGDRALDITFTKTNGETVSAHGISFDCYGGGENVYFGCFVTDQGVYSVEFTFEQDTENAFNLKNLSLTIGDMTSNTLQNCKWVKAQYYKSWWTYYCCMASWCNYLNIQFDGTLTQDNIDGIIALATHFDDDFNGFLWEDAIEDDIGMYVILSAEEVQRRIEKYFGVANADLTLAHSYDAKTDTVKIYELSGEFYIRNSTIVYEDGQWVLNCTFTCDTEHPTFNLIVTEDMVIQHIDMPMPEISYADMNGNGELDLSDYASMANIAIGKQTPTTYDRLCGDLNADTVVDFFDVSLLDLILSGKYTLQEILDLKRS